MNKIIIILSILFLTSMSTFAIPQSLDDDPGGWLDIGLNYTLAYPLINSASIGHNGGLFFSGTDYANWGLGISFVIGQNLLELTFDFHYQITIPGADLISIPVYLKAGWMNSGIGIAAETGLKYFFLEIPGRDGLNSYLTTEVLAGMHILLYSIFKEFAPDITTPLYIPVAAANFTFAFPVPESDYDYMYY